MFRKFYSTGSTARKRGKRAAEREKVLEILIGNNGNVPEYEVDFSTSQIVSINNDIFPPDTSRIDDFALSQPDNAVPALASSENVDDDDDVDVDTDLAEYFLASNVDYQRKIYTGSFLWIRDACEIIIKLS